MEEMEQGGIEKDANEPCCKCGPKHICRYRTCHCVASSTDDEKVYCTNCKAGPRCVNRPNKDNNLSRQAAPPAPIGSEIEEDPEPSAMKNEAEVLRLCVAKLQKTVEELQAESKRQGRALKEQNEILREQKELITLIGQRLKEEVETRQSLESKITQFLADQKNREHEKRVQPMEMEAEKDEEAERVVRKRGREEIESEQESKRVRRDSKQELQPHPMEVTPSRGKDQKRIQEENRGDVKEGEADGDRPKEKQRSNDQWEEKRKVTLILKGLASPGFRKVVDVLEQYSLARREDVVKVHRRNVQGNEWAFITLSSEEKVQSAIRNRFKLKGTLLFIQKDLSKEVREKMKAERLAKRTHQVGLNSFINPERQSQIQHPAPSQASGVVETVPLVNMVSQYPNARPVGVPQPRNFNLASQQFPQGVLFPNQNAAWAQQNPAASYWPIQPSFGPGVQGQTQSFRWGF